MSIVTLFVLISRWSCIFCVLLLRNNDSWVISSYRSFYCLPFILNIQSRGYKNQNTLGQFVGSRLHGHFGNLGYRCYKISYTDSFLQCVRIACNAEHCTSEGRGATPQSIPEFPLRHPSKFNKIKIHTHTLYFSTLCLHCLTLFL